MNWKDIYETSRIYMPHTPHEYTSVGDSKDFMDTLSKISDVVEAREQKLAKAGAIRRKIEAGDVVHLTLEGINKLFMVNGLIFNGAYLADGGGYTDTARAIEDRIAFKVVQVEKATVPLGFEKAGSEYLAYKLVFYDAENYRDGITGRLSSDEKHIKDLLNGDEVLRGCTIDEEIIYVSKHGGHTFGLLADLED